MGDQIPSRLLGGGPTRRLDAIALLVPGARSTADYLEVLDAQRDEFAAWDGRLVVADEDGEPAHRLLVVDRYRQVYAVHDVMHASELPDASALAEWFRFLATACPECGVLDDPLLAGPTP